MYTLGGSPPVTDNNRRPSLSMMQAFRHSPGTLIVHALLVAMLCSLPQWIGVWQNHGDYSPFSVSPAVSAITFDETHAYAPPARRLLSIGKIRAEVDNYENRNLSAGIPFVPTAILGGMGWALGSLERSFVAADLIFPALLFVLFYAIAATVVEESILRLLVAWSTVIVPFGVLNSIWLGDDAHIAPLELTRTPQPEISFLALILAAALLGKAIAEESDWLWTLAAGTLSGIVVYCYYFYAVAWGATLGLLLILGLVWKIRLVWRRAASALGLMLLLSIPYAVATVRGKEQGGQTYLLERMGAFTHRPDFVPLFFGLVLTVALLVSGRDFCRLRPIYFVLTLLIAGSLLGMNLQILSGYETQHWHFWKRLALPVFFFVVASALAHSVEESFARKIATVRKIAQVLLSLLILETAARLAYAGVLTAPYYRASNPDIAMLVWVRSHLPDNQVIGTADPKLILLIPALTADYTYVPSGLRSLTSTGGIVNRYFEIACLLGLSEADVVREAAVPNHLGHSSELLQVLGLSYTGDRAIYQWFVNQYKAQATCGAPKWRLDYLAVPAGTTAETAARKRFPSAPIVYRSSEWELLELRHAGPS